ncbi:oligoendopeptidase F [Staphylococcus massiliensis]|uniref:oligoendopeptidase F n=1 Tax=Staphylococcus massiliensis TaxID=555791 RepID=UPI001EE0F2D6|nr:oligoendopeptidase F [Staphylococcus massiliensis]MCG3398603.1 oligoendopeptidase F [Staphylococcus massiliensis]
MTNQLPTRQEVTTEETWDLTDLFPSDKAFYETLDDTLKATEKFHDTYKNRLTDKETIIEALKEYSNLLIQYERLANYSGIQLSVDTANPEYQKVEAKFVSVSGEMARNLTFVQSELLELDEDLLNELIETSEYPYYLTKLKALKPYQLDPNVEEALASFSPIFYAPMNLYGTTKMLDLQFGDFEVDGKTYPMDYVTFENEYEDHPDTNFRRKSFEHFSDALRKYQHTTAETYNLHVQREKIEADLRGYDSVIDFLLQSHDVTRDMYDRQIDIIMEELAPIMRKYAQVIKRTNQLDQIRFEDLKISVDPTYEPDISIETSKKYMYGALEVLGKDYLDMVKRAYDERWIDFPKNKNKDTGAYCASPYASHSYIFISWSGKMTEAFVLVHELGHAGHFTLTHDNQNYLESEPSMYFVEAPSTMNEMLMAQYLFKNSNNAKFKRWVIGSIISRTYYHNMVTHLLEACYQREVYRRVDEGEVINAPVLNEIKRNVIERFWGDEILITEGAELTWMRQPHYYMGLYPYTYSAGLTIGTVMAKRIQNEGQVAVDDWIKTLKAGGSMSPIDLAHLAGIDITTEKPLKETIAYIGELVDELEALTDEIEAHA